MAQSLEIAFACASGSDDPPSNNLLHDWGLASVMERLARGVKRRAHHFGGGVIKYAAR